MNRIHIEIDDTKLKELVMHYLESILGVDVDIKDVEIQVKSKQNYKSEWERAEFKAVVDKVLV